MTPIFYRPAQRRQMTHNHQSPAYAQVPGVGNEARILKKMPCNVRENAEGIIVDMAVPGFDRSDLTIRIAEGKLYVSGKKEMPEELKYMYREFSTDEFENVFVLSKEVDVDSISASVVNGLLSLTIQKYQPVQARKIEIL